MYVFVCRYPNTDVIRILHLIAVMLFPSFGSIRCDLVSTFCKLHFCSVVFDGKCAFTTRIAKFGVENEVSIYVYIDISYVHIAL